MSTDAGLPRTLAFLFADFLTRGLRRPAAALEAIFFLEVARGRTAFLRLLRVLLFFRRAMPGVYHFYIPRTKIQV
jgi:hypothetical protein